MIRFSCGTCHERLAVPVRYAGRRGKCPACGGINLVPLASEFPEPLPEPVMIRAGRVPGSKPSPAGPLEAQPLLAAPNPSRPGTAALPARVAPVAWSAPAPPPARPLPEVAPLPDDIPPGEMILVSAFNDDAGGMSTFRKALIAIAVLLGLAGVIWGVSYLLILVRMRMTQG